MSRKFNFESLAVAEKRQSIQDEQNYQNLLREIAADHCTRSDDEVLQIVQRAERDVKTLEEDAAERAERDRMIAAVKSEPELQGKSDDLLKQYKTLRAEFEKIQKEYENKWNPLCHERDRLEKQFREIRGYRSKLYGNCPDKRLVLELEMLEHQWDDRAEEFLYERQNRIDSEIRYMKQDLERNIISPHRREEQRALKAKIKELQSEFEEIEVKKSELAAKKMEHENAVAKHREAMMFA